MPTTAIMQAGNMHCYCTLSRVERLYGYMHNGVLPRYAEVLGACQRVATYPKIAATYLLISSTAKTGMYEKAQTDDVASRPRLASLTTFVTRQNVQGTPFLDHLAAIAGVAFCKHFNVCHVIQVYHAKFAVSLAPGCY